MSKSNSKVELRLPPDIREALKEVIDYLWRDEEKHSEEFKLDGGKPKNHIFSKLATLDLWLKSTELENKTALSKYPMVLLLDALLYLNLHHGRGHIGMIDFVTQNVLIKKQIGCESAKFREKNGFVYFRGHKKKYL